MRGFLRFRTPDWLTFVYGCLGANGVGVCWAKGHLVMLESTSTMVGTLGISLGTFGTLPLKGPFLGGDCVLSVCIFPKTRYCFRVN